MKKKIFCFKMSSLVCRCASNCKMLDTTWTSGHVKRKRSLICYLKFSNWKTRKNICCSKCGFYIYSYSAVCKTCDVISHKQNLKRRSPFLICKNNLHAFVSPQFSQILSSLQCITVTIKIMRFTISFGVAHFVGCTNCSLIIVD